MYLTATDLRFRPVKQDKGGFIVANITNRPEVMKKKVKSGYASVNGLNMYYEIHGTGTPLVLLHGALSEIDASFGRVLPSFAKTRQVIAVEQQAHGHTADIDRPLSIEQMAEDTVALLRQLKIGRAEAVQSINAPTLVIIGDSDIVRPEHAVQMFRLLGEGVAGDVVGLPRSQLAVLPGTTHVTLVERASWLVSMITAFLEAATFA